MGARIQQAYGFMLAVNLDQQGADLPQGSDAGGLVVDEGPAPAIRGQDAAQDQVLARRSFKPPGLEEAPDCMAGRK